MASAKLSNVKHLMLAIRALWTQDTNPKHINAGTAALDLPSVKGRVVKIMMIPLHLPQHLLALVTFMLTPLFDVRARWTPRCKPYLSAHWDSLRLLTTACLCLYLALWNAIFCNRVFLVFWKLLKKYASELYYTLFHCLTASMC